MFAPLANGVSTFKNTCSGEDVHGTIEILKSLGANIDIDKNSMSVQGTGLHCLIGKDLALDCGNSGTTLRLLTGLLSGQSMKNVSLVGDDSLSKRPHDRVINPLTELGVDIVGREGVFTPVTLNESIPNGGRIKLNIASAQVKSAILLSGLYAMNPTTVIETRLTRNHTELMLGQWVYHLKQSVREEGIEITIYPPTFDLSPFNDSIPGDPSSAAFFGIAASVIPQSDIYLRSVLLNPTRIGWVEVLQEMGANIEVTQTGTQLGEVVGDIRIKYSQLRAINISDNIASLVDELPILTLAMAHSAGKSSVRNASELRVKESDRISVVVDHLLRAGINAIEHEDGYTIQEGILTPVEVKASGDHRMALTFAISNYISTGELDDQNSDVIATSFPTFFSTFESLISK